MFRISLFCLTFLLTACVGIPEGVEPITGFEIDRYLGTWYEIARLDHRFEKGLTDVVAEYSLNEDGSVKVINSGYDVAEKQRRSAEGQAYFVETPAIGRLKVSFFGPFYGAYNIIVLDKKHYRYAMVAGDTKDYLWILARSPQLEPETLQSLVAEAKRLGFPADELIYSQSGQ